ncbi:oxygenase MpaB family protein [Algoriphagus aquatilis]|uniref:Oxygenase MpaB family protein n=1 Tax=Algoriphagus aquatilis TaxID=490186 RepID=A0ABW0C106_9BACT
MPRKPFSYQITQLDPAKDHEQISFLLSCHVLPWDLERALEFALFRTFAIPSISGLLAQTGEFQHRPRKRYDDTELILFEILEHGMNSLRGKRAIRRMNSMHGRFEISNDDFLYVLSTFIFEPIRWLEKYAYRPMTELEKQGVFKNYLELGRRMNLKDVPQTLEEFERFNLDYEAKHFQYAASNRLIADKTIDLLLGFYLPKWLFGVGRPFVFALLDEPLRVALGIRKVASWRKVLMKAGLRVHAIFHQISSEPTEPVLGTRRKRPTYPEGYQIEELGTFPFKSSQD